MPEFWREHSDSTYWRATANQARTHVKGARIRAKRMTDKQAQRVTLEIAETCENLARSAQSIGTRRLTTAVANDLRR